MVILGGSIPHGVGISEGIMKNTDFQNDVKTHQNDVKTQQNDVIFFWWFLRYLSIPEISFTPMFYNRQWQVAVFN